MTDWSNLRLTAKSRKTLETELAAARGDYQKTMQGVSDYVDTLVGDLFDFDHPDKSLALTDPDAIVDAARNLVEVAQTAADNRYGVQRQAWQQAAGREFLEYALPDREDWTRVMWDVQKGFANTDYNGLTYRQVMAGKARSGVSIMDLLPKTAGMSIDDMQQAYADFFRSMAIHAAQRRQMANIANDPTRPRWARVPRGSVTCAFCTMLAGRGFVYTSEEAAGGGLGNVYHAHCDCEPVPTWGEAKLAGYDPERLDALYREAVRGLPAGASYRDVLSRMRANGGVADSPATQAGSGSGGKPPKPLKARGGTPEPEEPKSEGNSGEGEDPAKASKQVLRRSMCRASVEKGNVASQYQAAVAAGETRGFDAWLGDMVAREVATRDPDWVSGAVDECRIAKRPGARPWKKEKRTAAVLARNGFGVEFIPEIDKTHVKTPDAVLNDGLEWEFKVPDGWNPEKTIKNQFKKATGKGTSKLVISNFQNKADGSEMREKIAEFMETDDFQEIDEVLFVDATDGSVTRFRR